MGKQVSFYLDDKEIRSLMDVAISECRTPQAQAKYFVLKALGITRVRHELPNATEDGGDELTQELASGG